MASFRFRNAWWGRAAVFPSWAVRMTLSVSEAPNCTACRKGLLGEILYGSALCFAVRKHKRLHFSLKPPPTPVPLPCTATVASVKPHEAPDTSTEQQASRRNKRLEGGSCMIAWAKSEEVVVTQICWSGWLSYLSRNCGGSWS